MTFDLQPHLKSELLILRPLTEEDREALFIVASDPLLWEQHPQNDRYQRPVFDAFFDVAMKSKGALLALEAKTGQVIGSSRYYNCRTDGSAIEIGYTFLSRACWGHGYNRQMKKLMMDHAFRFVESVFFYVGENNRRSRKAVEKIGGELVGEFVSKLADGSPSPSVIYKITKEKGMK